MAESRRALEWSQTAEVLAMVHNVNCARKDDQVKANELNPTYKPTRPVYDPDDYMSIEDFARIWVEGGRHG